jgi:hypothetical protein
MKEPIRFARIHYTIKSDSIITHEFILNLIKTNSDEKPESDNFAKVKEWTSGETKSLEVWSTEKIYRIVYNKKLKATIIIDEKN